MRYDGSSPALEGGEGEGGIGNELGPATDIVQPLELELVLHGYIVTRPNQTIWYVLRYNLPF